MKNKLTMKVVPAALLAVFSTGALASGFALQNQTGSGNGNAFAGAAASAEDAGTVFFNPAGMTNLPEGHSLSVAATVLKRSIKFTDTGTTGIGAAGGTNGGDAGGVSIIPAAYWSMSLSPALRVGLGISPTFGNTTEYDDTFYGRYSGYYADMKQININPSIAYKVSEQFSVGFGLNYAKNETEFRQKVFVGAASDVRLKGDATAVGYNLGVTWKPTEATRVGVAYRSELDFDLEGVQTASVPFGAALLASEGVTAKLTTPSSLSLAVSHKLNDRLELLVDYTATGWGTINQIPVTRAGGGAHAGLTYNFKDSYRVGVGANYTLDGAWKLRAGVALDKTPVRSAADTTMTLPDSDRTWLSFGAKYTLSKSNSIDVGYTHIFFKEATTARAVGGAAPHVINGTFDTSADLLSLQYNHNF